MIGLLLAFALTLYIAALLSEMASRTPLSATLLFLIAGFLIGNGALGVVRLPLDDPLVEHFAQLALLAVLFVDGMRLDVHDLMANRTLPERALLLGLPLTLLITAALAHFVADLTWPQALLLGAILSPTDPVFASALIGKRGISNRLKHLLNIESGLNDGLALPIVLGMVAVLWGSKPTVGKYALDVGLGVLIGVAVTWVALRLYRVSGLSVTDEYQPMLAVAIGLAVYAATTLARGNSFLGMFAAAATLVTVAPDVCRQFRPFGEKIVELVKLAALLLFGALLSLNFLQRTNLKEFLLAFLILVLARPIGLGIALLGSRLGWRERVVGVWFGPRGFASVVYAMFVLGSSVSDAFDLFRLSAVVILVSMLAHSSTDILAARWLQRQAPQSESHTVRHRYQKTDQDRASSPMYEKEKNNVSITTGSEAADEVER